MKKTLITVGIALFLTGCSGMIAEQQKKQQESYDNLTKCEPFKARSSNTQPTKELLISQLNAEARSASADDFEASTKMRTLQLVGWNESVANAIITCRTDNRNARIESIKPVFDSVKAKTKDKDEKKALIEAYSAWEAYLNSLTPAAKQDFETKLSFYKNI